MVGPRLVDCRKCLIDCLISWFTSKCTVKIFVNRKICPPEAWQRKWMLISSTFVLYFWSWSRNQNMVDLQSCYLIFLTGAGNKNWLVEVIICPLQQRQQEPRNYWQWFPGGIRMGLQWTKGWPSNTGLRRQAWWKWRGSSISAAVSESQARHIGERSLAEVRMIHTAVEPRIFGTIRIRALRIIFGYHLHIYVLQIIELQTVCSLRWPSMSKTLHRHQRG